MKKKPGIKKRNLALPLFGDKPPFIKVELDPAAPKEERILLDHDADDNNCACE